MRVQGPPPGLAGVTGASTPLGPSLVDRVMQAETLPVEQVKARRANTLSEKNEYSRLSGLLDDLGGMANKMQMPAGFRQMMVESSHPDLIDAAVDGAALPGNYEFEVRGLAQAERWLEAGFEDVDRTPVGFGFMEIERQDGAPVEVQINPGSTLKDVADRINNANAGVKAQIIDTGVGSEPFRLSVVSEKTGAAARLKIDEDTTHLGFEKIKSGRNLELNFEDVAVSRSDNQIQDLIPGLKLEAKRAEPGTRVQMSVQPDVDKTLAGLKEFTGKYNEIANFAKAQVQLNPETGRAGQLAADSSLRQVMRGLQQQIATPLLGQRFASLAEVGITSNAKTGELNLDEQKLKGALATDYDGVMQLFTQGEGAKGVFARLSEAIRQMKDPVAGPVSGRVKTLERQIRDQDREIERKGERLEQRRAQIERQFAAVNTRMAGMQSQEAMLQARFGGVAPSAGGTEA